MFNNPKTRSIFNFLVTPTIDKEIDQFCKHIMINKFKELGKYKNNKVKVKNESREKRNQRKIIKIKKKEMKLNH